MIYNKETALEKARELSRRIREKTEPFDPEAEIAAVLFEAQAEALESLEDGDPYDQPTAEGEDVIKCIARLRAMAAELRGE